MGKMFSSFSKALDKAKTEEEVKHAYAEHFELDYDTELRHDLYSPGIFYEFKFSRSLQKRESSAAVIAQVRYYIRGLRFGHAEKVAPPVICVADGKQSFLAETKKWRTDRDAKLERHDLKHCFATYERDGQSHSAPGTRRFVHENEIGTGLNGRG